MSDGFEARRGRPRDPLIDKRVLDATRRLLAHKGLAGTTVQAVARASGVRPNAIYRRWPARMDLIEEAIFPGFDSIAFEPTGDLAKDIARFAEIYRSVLAQPEVLAAVPFLLSTADGAGPSTPQRRDWRSVRPLFRDILRAAGADVVDASLDPDDVFDLLVGAILLRAQLLALGIRTGSPDRTVDLVLRALHPAHAGPGKPA